MIEPREELRALAPAIHGGAAPDGVLDFSTGVSPLPAPARVLEAARSAELSRYPHPTAGPLRERLALVHDARPDELVAGAGSVELIWAMARAFGGPGRRALVFAPAFGEYAQALRACGTELVEVRGGPPSFAIDPEAARAALAGAPSLAFVCRPANPTLQCEPLHALALLVRSAPHTLFVADEAYLPLFDGVEPVPRLPNLAILRSMTKVFALPGLRLGYLLAAPEIARAVQASLPPWNVSSPAQAAGLAAADALGELPAIRREIARLRGRLIDTLGRAGLDAEGGPFTLWRVGDARATTARLDAAGVRVRDCTSFGLPEHVRLGVRPELELARLAAAWR